MMPSGRGEQGVRTVCMKEPIEGSLGVRTAIDKSKGRWLNGKTEVQPLLAVRCDRDDKHI